MNTTPGKVGGYKFQIILSQTFFLNNFVQVLLNKEDAIHTCNSLHGKLAYPTTIDEYNTWKSRWL